MVRIAGVDGCRTGWIAAVAEMGAQAPPALRVVRHLSDVLAGENPPAIVAIDMPIGLPDRIVGSGRGPEQLVRAMLGARRSSVFSIPARSAVHAEDYAESCRLALDMSDPPRKVSKQGYHLFPKIREIDALLRAEPGRCDSVFEVHPELAFRTMRGSPLVHPKKIRGVVNPPGMVERRALLIGAGLPFEIVHAPPPKGAGADDVLDALAALVVARHIAAGRGRPFPDPPGRDSHGLPIAIWTYSQDRAPPQDSAP